MLILTEYWGDPYIGAGGRYNLNKAFYLTGKVDVGGFDVGSKVTVQANGGLGCELTRSIYAELASAISIMITIAAAISIRFRPTDLKSRPVSNFKDSLGD